MLLKLPCHQETNYAAQRISDHIVRLGKPQAGGKLGGLDKQCQGKGKPEDFPLRTEAVKSCSQWNKQPDKVICEEYLETNDPLGLVDYRFYCFNGRIGFIAVDVGTTANNGKHS